MRECYRTNRICHHLSLLSCQKCVYTRVCRLMSRASEIFCRRRTAVSAILTNVSHKDLCAILSSGDVTRRAQRPNGSLGVLLPRRQGVRRANWFAFAPQRIRRARAQSGAPLLAPNSLLHSPFRTTSYIYLRISLFYERPALFASLNYRKHVLPVITPVDRPTSRCRMQVGCAGCMLFIADVAGEAARARCNPLANQPLLNDLSDVTWCYEC